MKKLFVVFALILAFTLTTVSLSATAADLPADVKQALEANKLSADYLGVWVQAVDSDKPLLTHNPDLPLNPASVMKLVTSLAALDMLGPTYTWPTEVFANGPIKQGVLKGDLFIKGYGDPWFRTEDLWRLVRQVRELGIHTIEGRLILDDSYFAPVDEDPAAFDNRPSRPYNALPRALLLDNRLTRFVVQPDAETGAIRVNMWPPQPSVSLINQIEPDAGLCTDKTGWPVVDIRNGGDFDTVRLSGRYSLNCGVRDFYRVVGNPDESFFKGFEALFSERGGVIRGGYGKGVVPSDAKLLFVQESQTLAEYLQPINKFSNNVMARQVFLTIGAQQMAPPATTLKAQRAIEAWLNSLGLKFPEFVIENGSGLSRIARISPRNMATLLKYGWESPTMPEFISSMPIIGVDGTMRRRLQGDSVSGRGHFKTGTLRDVRAGAGYIMSRSGRRYIVVIMHNQPAVQLGGGTQVQDAIIKWVYDNG